MTEYDKLFGVIADLVMLHSPSGVEGEIDAWLMARFVAGGHLPVLDQAGNVIVKIAGNGGGSVAITAHKDEIGASVTQVSDDGRVRVRKLGGSFPWVYGEGIVDLLGDVECVSGVLSFGSRHVSHASPQQAQQKDSPLKWEDVWVETKRSAANLAEAGIRPGTRMVVGKHRKAPYRLGDYIASYTLDNKASLAILIELAERVREPLPDIYLVATSKEEIGGAGAAFFAQHHHVDALIALEIVPLSSEYTIDDVPEPVMIVEDGVGIYDEALGHHIRSVARACGVPVQIAIISSFGSEGVTVTRNGSVARGACVGFPTENTHGFEIARLGAISRCIDLLDAVCRAPLDALSGASSASKPRLPSRSDQLATLNGAEGQPPGNTRVA